MKSHHGDVTAASAQTMAYTRQRKEILNQKDTAAQEPAHACHPKQELEKGFLSRKEWRFCNSLSRQSYYKMGLVSL